MGTLENSSYSIIVPKENLGKYAGIDLLGTMRIGNVPND